MVRHTDHITGIGGLSDLTVLRQEHHRIVDIELFALSRLEAHAAIELTGDKPEKSHAVAVVWVHVRLELEDETCNAFVIALNGMIYAFFLAVLRAWWRRELLKRLQQFPNPEMAKRCAKNDGGHVPLEESPFVYLWQHFQRHLAALFQLFTRG